MATKPKPAAPQESVTFHSEFEQGSPEWYAIRAGKITASEMHTVMASGKGGGPSLTRAAYMRRLAGEIITGDPGETFTSPAMERGKQMEAEALADFKFTNPKLVVTPVAFIERQLLTGKVVGASPDAMVGDDATLEIKTCKPEILIQHLLRNAPPPEHHAQIQTALWVTGRKRTHLKLYWPKMPRCVYVVERDEMAIRQIQDASAAFQTELDQMVAWLRKIG